MLWEEDRKNKNSSLPRTSFRGKIESSFQVNKKGAASFSRCGTFFYLFPAVRSEPGGYIINNIEAEIGCQVICIQIGIQLDQVHRLYQVRR